MAELLGQRSGTACWAWEGQTGEHKHRVFPSWRQLLLAATGSLEENMLPLLWYWLSTRVKNVLIICKFWTATTHFLFLCEMKFLMRLARCSCRPKPRPLLCSILLSVIGICVKLWHTNKTACSQSNPVQSSRSKSTTCLRKGCLLTFKLHSTETSDGGVQKLGNDVWHDSELIATTACSPIGSKWNVMFESHVVTGRALIFNLKIFLSNLPL